MSRKAEIAVLKMDWKRLLDRMEGKDVQVSALAVAMWATLNVDRLIALAEEAK